MSRHPDDLFLDVLYNDPRKAAALASGAVVDMSADGSALTRQTVGDDDGTVEIGNPEAYVAAALDRHCAEVAETGEGERNHRLNAAAFSLGRLLAAELPLDEDDVVERLSEAAAEAGLGAHEIAQTIRSGLRGGQRRPLSWTRSEPVAMATPLVVEAVGVSVSGGVTRTSWWPRDIDAAIDGDEDADERPPAFLRRDDGEMLLYRGKVNALIGESESGKTWVALHAVEQLLRDGGRALVVDFEDSKHGVVARLRAMGVAADALRSRFRYISPDEPLSSQARADLGETLVTFMPELVVVDGVNAAMTLLGLDLQDNKDATTFSQQVLKPIARTGAAVVTVDHVTKSKDNRGSYAIGAQAKRADVDGAALIVEVVEPFGRGMTGKVKLTVGKDRPGFVRAKSTGAKRAGMAVIASTDDEHVAVVVRAPLPDDADVKFRPTHLMQRVSVFVEGLAEHELVNRESIVRALRSGGDKFRNDALTPAITTLVDEGFLEYVAGSKMLRSARPYRQADDPGSDAPPPAVPIASPDVPTEPAQDEASVPQFPPV